MKKYLYIAMLALSGIWASCSNDEIEVSHTVTVTIDPSDLFSCYDFKDTRHDIEQISDTYRTFNSEYGLYIQARSLFYNRETDELVDSIVQFCTNTNSFTISKLIPAGKYYVVTTLCFADKDKDSWWTLTDGQTLSTANLYARNRFSKWSIMSQSVETVDVLVDSDAPSVITKPQPVGTLVYEYYQNFQYRNASSTSTVSDNNVREIALYTQSAAKSYNLSPKATNKFNYREATGLNSWYYADYHEPSHFDKTWTFFKSNLYGFCYIMEPQAKLCFGYTLKNESYFHGYGEKNYTLAPGVMQLAYWDWFQVGNPYFGTADNNHWHVYTYNAPKFEQPNGQLGPVVRQELPLTVVGEAQNWQDGPVQPDNM